MRRGTDKKYVFKTSSLLFSNFILALVFPLMPERARVCEHMAPFVVIALLGGCASLPSLPLSLPWHYDNPKVNIGHPLCLSGALGDDNNLH